MQSRLWLRIIQSLPFPLRWIGTEFALLMHWLDHRAARIAVGLRHSPAWFFVTTVGMLGVGLTLLLFLSLIEQTDRPRVAAVHPPQSGAFGRHRMENAYEWSAQDRWRVAHLFLPHRPPRKPREIQLDSRLHSVDQHQTPDMHRRPGGYSTLQEVTGKEADVRLELSRPRRAEQDQRMIAGFVFRGADPPDAQLLKRESRLRVQASWDFGPDCLRDDYLTMPTRRTIPVPRPEPETPPIHRIRPDLGFVMEILRRSSDGAYFPPGSHLVSESRRSSFPPDERWPISQVSSDADYDWRRSARDAASFSDHRVVTDPHHGLNALFARIPYVADDSDEVNEALPSVSQVQLRVEWNAPGLANPSQYQQTRLVVENEGQDAVQKLELQDLLSAAESILEMSPQGREQDLQDAETGATVRYLHRDGQALRPGEASEFVLKWIPEGGRQAFHRSRVIAHAAVYASTDVTRPPEEVVEPPERHPALACDVQYLDRAYVGDKVEIEITVRNTGDVSLHQVQLRVGIPEQLTHPDGKMVIFDVGDLDVRGQNQTVLKLSAAHTGDAVNLVEVAAAEEVQVRGNTRMLIVDRLAEPKSPPSPEIIPATPKLTPIPAVKAPSGECCCQRAPFTSNVPAQIRP